MGRVRNPELLQKFGARLRAIRLSKGISIESLAGMAEIEYTQIARIETGKINTTISTAERLAATLGVPLFHLFIFEAVGGHESIVASDLSDPK